MSAIETIVETIRRHHHHEPVPITDHQTACSFCGDIIGEGGWPIGFYHPAVPDLTACPKPECHGTIKDMARQALSTEPTQGQRIGGSHADD